MRLFRRGPSQRRSAAGAVLALFVATGVIVVFTGTLTRSTSIEAEAERVRAEVAALEERVAIGSLEVSFLETDAFVEQVARTVQWGERDERPFALHPDAPSPRPIVPLGSARSADAATAPFDAWMELLFGV